MAEVSGNPPNVALLGRDDAVRSQLRVALDELGANLVYEGELRGADPAQVAAALPAVVLFNLDAGGEDGLDGLETLLLDPSIRVVFNEAETTATLSGWDLARWARHLAAKVLGHDRTIPPPPEGAEFLPLTDLLPVPGAPPTPESQAETLSMSTLEGEASSLLESVPTSAALASAAVVPELDGPVPDAEEGALDIDVDAVEGALAGLSVSVTDDEADAGSLPASQSAPAVGDEAFDGGIDFAEIETALAGVDSEVGSVETDETDAVAAETAEFSTLGLEAELEALSLAPLDEAQDAAAIGAGFDPGAGTEANADTDAARIDFSTDPDEASESGELDAAVAALAAQLEALEGEAPRGEMEVRDPDFFFDLGDGESPAEAPSELAKPVGFDSSLSLDDGDLTPGSATPAPKPKAPEIDISALSLEPLPDPGLLADLAKPKKPEDEPYLPRPGIDLTLAPREPFPDEDEAPPPPSHAAVKADIGETFDLTGLALEPLGEEESAASAAAASGIPRVLVLGASIGGPDALRTFLAGLPADFPALFVLAQHLESGFFDRLAQQLQKVSRLPIRVASDSTPAVAGEVLVIPSGERIHIERDGSIRREPHLTPTHYRPCIDDVMRDIADSFGSRATAIIFSGMAGDAVEGAVYLTSKGGEVWVQDPGSCVVSSMVDGAQARGVVEFSGSPRELAEHCVARFGHP